MAYRDGMKEYHCTQPCNGGDCTFKFKVDFGTELPTQQGVLKIQSVFQHFYQPAYGNQPSQRYWEVYAHNGNVEPGHYRFWCTNSFRVKTSQGRYSGPLALRIEEEPF